MSSLNSPYDVPENQRRIDLDQMTLSELRQLLDKAETFGAPPEAVFQPSMLTRGTFLVSWALPGGEPTAVDIRRACPCGHADCPDRSPL